MNRVDHIQLLEHALAQSLSGCFVEREAAGPGDRGLDCVVVCPPSKFATRIVSVTAPRVSDVLGRLAVAVLERKSWCFPDGAAPFVVVVMPSWGSKMVEAVRDFIERLAGDVSWMLVTPQGSHHLELKAKTGLVVVERTAEPGPQPQRPISRKGSLFSDLNRWMLKLLILRHAPKSRWPGHRGKIPNPTHLGRIAGVSVETAHQFVRAFAERDFLRAESGDLKLVRVREMLEAWLAEERRVSPAWTHARSIDGGPFDLERALASRPQGMVALGGFEACRRHGLLHTTPGVPLVLSAEALPAVVAAWDLGFCGQQEAQVMIAEPRHRASVFRAVGLIDGLPVVDILQAALDVAPMPGRGLEQAEFVIEEILSWRSS
ncbi:MAG: hypothetical protein PHU25_20265 [Deltaproteobacteria bacterium]|nr:hypothetical protein [Deltaproteobacteria bacterium]